MATAQIIVKKGSTVVDIVDSASPSWLATAIGVNTMEAHKMFSYTTAIFNNKDGTTIGSGEIPIVWGIPTGCRKARPCISAAKQLWDLEKFYRYSLSWDSIFTREQIKFLWSQFEQWRNSE